jgi:hypothetical protein
VRKTGGKLYIKTPVESKQFLQKIDRTSPYGLELVILKEFCMGMFKNSQDEPFEFLCSILNTEKAS